jgi:two-component system, LuxR family, sensor kinase FixL
MQKEYRLAPAADALDARIERLEQIRDRLANLVLLAFSILAVPAVAASLSRARQIGWTWEMSVHIGLAVALWATTFLRSKLPYNARVSAVLLIFFSMAAASLLRAGPVGHGFYFLLIAAVLATVFWGTWAGVGTLVASAAIVSIAAWDICTGHVQLPDLNASSVSAVTWMTHIASFLMFVGLAVISVGRLTMLLARSNESLRDRTRQLAATNEALQAEMEEHRKAREAELRSQQNYREIFDASNDAIVLHDAQTGRILDVNQTTVDMFGYTREEVTARSIQDFSQGEPPYSQGEAIARVQAAATRGPQVFEWKARRRNGEVFWAEVSLRSSRIGGQGRVLASVRDIAERKHTEEALRELSSTFSSLSPEELFNSVAGHIARTLEIEHVFIGELLPGGGRVRILGGYQQGQDMGPGEYALVDTPCENVIGKTTCCYPSGVRELFPRDQLLAELGVESYIGSPLFDLAGRPIGILAAMDAKPLAKVERAKALFGVFASRIVVEIERKRARDALRESERRLATLISNLPGIAYRCRNDAAWTMEFISDGCSALSGYCPQELTMNSGRAFGDLIYPEDRPHVWAEVQAALVARKPYQVQYRLVRRDGAIRWVWERGQGISNGSHDMLLEGFITDITERLDAEEALRQSEQKYRTLFETAADAILLMEDDKFVDCNRHTLRVYHATREQIIGHSPVDFSTPVQPDGRDSGEKAHERIATARAGQPQFFEWRLARPDGTAIDTEVSLNAVQLGGRVYLLALVHDVSQRKAMEDAVRKLNVELEERVQERTAELEAANRDLSEFAYVVSHDLKAPLRGVSQLAQWLSEDYAPVVDEDGREKLALLLGRVKRMYNLIDGILAYSRIGRVEMAEERIELDPLVRDVVELLAPPDNVRVVIESTLPVITAVRTHMQQVFQNLIGNAIKFMNRPDGLVRVSCEDRGDCWRFGVSDNGPGIAPQYHEKIFGIFQTLASRDQTESTGIGLTIAKRIVEFYGGRIEVDSAPGKGSTFSFTLPK